MAFLNDPVFGYLKRALDIAIIRQDVIASNIANADTPGYRAKNIPFKNVLELENSNIPLKVTDPRHIKSQQGLDYLVKPLTGDYLMKNDRNNVKLDEELMLLAKNTLLVKTLTAFEKYKFNQYKDLISSTRNA